MTNLASISDLSQDRDFYARVLTAATIAGIPNPAQWTLDHILTVAAHEHAKSDSMAAAYASALANPYMVKPGHNPAVIKDEKIVAAVQAVSGEVS